MARIRTYDNDDMIQTGDQLLGSNVINGDTSNFTVEALASFLTQTGDADSTKLGFQFNYTNNTTVAAGEYRYQLNTEFTDNDWRNIIGIEVSETNRNGTDFGPYSGVLRDQLIKITDIDTTNSSSYGLFRVGEPTTANNVITLPLTYIDATTETNPGRGVIVISPAGISASDQNLFPPFRLQDVPSGLTGANLPNQGRGYRLTRTTADGDLTWFNDNIPLAPATITSEDTSYELQVSRTGVVTWVEAAPAPITGSVNITLSQPVIVNDPNNVGRFSVTINGAWNAVNGATFADTDMAVLTEGTTQITTILSNAGTITGTVNNVDLSQSHTYTLAVSFENSRGDTVNSTEMVTAAARRSAAFTLGPATTNFNVNAPTGDVTFVTSVPITLTDGAQIPTGQIGTLARANIANVPNFTTINVMDTDIGPGPGQGQFIATLSVTDNYPRTGEAHAYAWTFDNIQDSLGRALPPQVDRFTNTLAAVGAYTARAIIQDGTTGDMIDLADVRVTNGNITAAVDSIDPTTYQAGASTYTVTYTVPPGFLQAGTMQTVDGMATGSAVAVYTPTAAASSIPNGVNGNAITVADIVISDGTTTAVVTGVNPTNYVTGTMDYNVNYVVPAGFQNPGVITTFAVSGTATAMPVAGLPLRGGLLDQNLVAADVTEAQIMSLAVAATEDPAVFQSGTTGAMFNFTSRNWFVTDQSVTIRVATQGGVGFLFTPTDRTINGTAYRLWRGDRDGLLSVSTPDWTITYQ